MIFGKAINNVTVADIEALVDLGVREDRHLDYKQELPKRDKDSKKFLADVSAFANSAGGDLVFGSRGSCGGSTPATSTRDGL